MQQALRALGRALALTTPPLPGTLLAGGGEAVGLAALAATHAGARQAGGVRAFAAAGGDEGET